MQKNKLAFIIHPRNKYDIYKKFPFFKILPNIFLQLFERKSKPIVVGKILKTESKEEVGLIISLPMTAKTMLENRNLSEVRINEAVNLGYNKNCNIVALGALTSSLVAAGRKVKNDGVFVTSGHTFTVLNITSILYKVTSDLDIDLLNKNIAIVGAAGSIGSSVARVLAKDKKIKNITLIDISRKLEKVKSLESELIDINSDLNIHITDELTTLKEADFIITATNHEEALIKPEHLHAPCVIIDDAQPSDIHEDIYGMNGILVLEGGAAHTPGFACTINLGLRDKEDSFSCMAEGLLLTEIDISDAKDRQEFNFEYFELVKEKAKQLGFDTANYQNEKEGFVSEDKIKEISEAFGTM